MSNDGCTKITRDFISPLKIFPNSHAYYNNQNILSLAINKFVNFIGNWQKNNSFIALYNDSVPFHLFLEHELETDISNIRGKGSKKSISHLFVWYQYFVQASCACSVLYVIRINFDTWLFTWLVIKNTWVFRYGSINKLIFITTLN